MWFSIFCYRILSRRKDGCGYVEKQKRNFKRISENRVSKILNLLSQLTNLSNSSFYEYTNEEIEKIFEAIEEEAKKIKEFLLKSNDKKRKNKRFEL